MRVLIRIAVLAFASAVACVVAEIGLRIVDGYRLGALRLVPARTVVVPPAAAADARAHAYVRALPLAEGVDREWFDRSPSPLPRRPLSPELERVKEQIAPLTTTFDMFKEWNARFIQDRVCSGEAFFDQFPGFAFAFEPDDRSPYPRYRYIPSITTPYGLVTNRFGFRGHEIAPDKPAGVIRVAAIGASTTVGSHSHSFSYPEFLEPWLNEWTNQYAPGVRVEVINAGREGIVSTDVAAIVRRELLPLEPDIVVYYEFANEFGFRGLIKQTSEALAAPVDLNPPRVRGIDRFDLMRRLDAIVQRFGVGSGAEPRKPPYRLDWPKSVDVAAPNPDDPNLPFDLPRGLHDLDDIRSVAAGSGAEVVITSFALMVKDGLIVDPVNQAYFYRMLNLSNWPARYSDIRRMADFQNRVFQVYAESRRVPFIDVAARFPLDVALFEDPIHMTQDGDRLRAWIVFQGLVPLLKGAIATHRLPRPDRVFFKPRPIEPLRRDPLVCTDFERYARIDGAAPLAALHASDADATVGGELPKHVITPKARYGYAAEVPIGDVAQVSGPGAVYMRFRVLSGSVTIGVLDKSRSSFLKSGTYAAGRAQVEMRLPLASMKDAGFVMITNAVAQDGERSAVDVEDLAILRPR